MLKTLQKIWLLLNIGENKKLYGLIVAIFLMGFLDMLGVASIFPFLSVISNPALIQTNSKLKWIYDRFGFPNKESFLVALGISSFVILVLCTTFRALTTKAVMLFSWKKYFIISKRLLAQYIHEPYVFFLDRNSSELVTYLMSEVGNVAKGVLIPVLQVFARIILTIFILAVLFTVNSSAAILVIGAIGGAYTLIYIFVRHKLAEIGKGALRTSKKMYKALYEAFGGIKDIKLMGKESLFIDKYAVPAKEMIAFQSERFLIGQLPQYAFEAMAFGGMLLITIFVAVVKKDQQQVVPLVGLYALAAYRLMPALQQVYQDLTNIRSFLPSLEIIYKDFMESSADYEKRQQPSHQILPFYHEVQFRDLTYQYPRAQDPVIENFNLVVKANMTVGFVGGSGAGKTTLIDVLLGLLRPQQGAMVVDGVIITEENLRSWQKNIGYVPQHIYLSDDTVTRNIAFGVPDNEIDHQAVDLAAQLANIHDFVVKELPQGYDTEVGERGIRLSGGQRQRIGIARAVYHNPCVLVFDEATSALDGITEDVILESIHRLSHKKTIIIVAHRLTTVKECDVIYMLERGKIIGQGTYEELLEKNQQFRKMAKVNSQQHQAKE
ncbi:MAG: ABC transporter ATP-binding protein [Candidatus Omnitrophica bacterium]|nr:ABC transporter ATP-binding protein [Candidatus Omnitrophota bacterium]